ncbi:MAG: hypothetical protein JOZ72_02060 [Alphaproteobacteria bacterium]|nr:hypothetical protein [Alphaproteobacteria bacterium]
MRGAAPTAALVVLCVITGCGKQDGAHKSADTAPDAAAANVIADIEQPFLFASAQGIYASDLDANRELSFVATPLVRGDYTGDEAKTKCEPWIFSHDFIQDDRWMAARALQRLEGTAFVRQGQFYVPIPSLAKAYRFWARNNRYGCRTWFYFDWGHFKVSAIERINEFKALDDRSGGMATARSYRVSATFVPSAQIAAVAPSVKFGTFTWSLALIQNPVTLEWRLMKFDGQTVWKP